MGASIAVFSSAIVLFFIRAQVMIDAIRCSTWMFYRMIFYPLIFTVAGIVSVFVLNSLLKGTTGIFSFSLYFGAFVTTFLVSTLIAEKFLNYRIVEVAKKIISLA